MNNFELILGPPGTGKTTTLLNLVDEYLQTGTPPERIGFVSFTKRAVTEAAERAVKRFGLGRERFQFFRTLHSLAFCQLGLRPGEVMQWTHYRELGRELGFTMTGTSRPDRDTYDLKLGDQALFVESAARLACADLHDTWESCDVDVGWLELRYIVDGLNKYKVAHLLTDYTDMLEKFLIEGYLPTLDVLIVDEVQDLSLLQWRILERLAENTRTILAGDDDQAIFRWSGAAVDYFLNLTQNLSSVRVLSKSYRVPSRVHEIAERVIDVAEDRRVKMYSPRDEAGVVEYSANFEDVDLSTGEWLILVRNHYLIEPIVEHLRICGYLYVGPAGDARDAPGARAALAWEKFRSGKKVDKSDVYYINKYRPRKLPSNLDNVDPDKRRLPWYEALDLPIEEREYYRAARRAGESFNRPPRIRVSTVHGAKGGECDQVLLCLDMSNRSYQSYLRRPGDEARVFYVAVTRARRRLVILTPQTNDYFQLPGVV